MEKSLASLMMPNSDPQDKSFCPILTLVIYSYNHSYDGLFFICLCFRWSNKKRLPSLGDEKATYDEVNKFYSFW